MHDDFKCVFSIPVKFEMYFLGIPLEIVLHVSKKYYICSLGVNFQQNSGWYGATRAPNSFLQLTWIIVGMVWSMISQLSDIKVVIDKRFRHL